MNARATLVCLTVILSLACAVPIHAGAKVGEGPKGPPVKTGPEVGSPRHIFHPLVVNGKHKGQYHSVVQSWHYWPAVLIFARSESEPLAKLIRRLDKQAAIVRKSGVFGVAAVYISTDEQYPEQLGAWAEQQGFERAMIAVADKPGGPEAYNIAKDADVTIIFLDRTKVQAVHGYRKGELTQKEVERIMKIVEPFSRRDAEKTKRD